MQKLTTFLSDKHLSVTLGADRRSSLTALVFVLALCVFEAVYFRNSFKDLLGFFETADSAVFWIVCLGYVLASVYLLFLFVLITLSSRWYYKALLVAFFSFAVFAQFGYANALGRFMIAQDLVSAFSATSGQRVDSVLAYSSYLSLLPGLALAVLGVFSKPAARIFGGGAFSGLVAAYLLFYLNVSFINPLLFDRKFASSSVGNFCLAAADYVLYDPVFDLTAKKREPVAAAVSPDSRPDNNVIFIFDESVRGDHLSLNGYGRPTTPYLEELERSKLLVNWGIAVSASTISHPSYDAMISGATPDMINALRFSGLNNLPSIFQYARSMNYRTHLVDGQMKKYWGGNDDDLNHIDNFVTLADIDSPDRVEDWERGDKITNDDIGRNDLKQWEIDERIALIVNGIFSGSKGNFVFVYKRGCHFPYEKNYPAEQAVWKPVYKFREQYEIPPADQIDAVKNSYDNALRYNLDAFFKRLAPNYGNLPNNTVIVYTSDHGQSFYADGRAGHGGESREEAMVPLFMIGVDAEKFDTGFPASHANVFTTLLDLFGFPNELRRREYSRSLFGARRENASPRFFNPPKGQKVIFDE